LGRIPQGGTPLGEVLKGGTPFVDGGSKGLVFGELCLCLGGTPFVDGGSKGAVSPFGEEHRLPF
jgi:hypothetical protein